MILKRIQLLIRNYRQRKEQIRDLSQMNKRDLGLTLQALVRFQVTT
jgi:uncharacterized protein YjiS (DUF1127 family)